ncbi:AUGMIN subunit 3-like isoform X3 [Phragmites australis]|uniref:AUGMIN subunit 3-like isoform X3 n=1 Tax=Phragmites australis TaxID=29695 RepID=UPI002D780CBB|nr:AUGMIN subunit 3-like isoform X3 [Phragmites australis]
MSAKQLCDALAAAGFDSDVPLDPESLESAFLQGDDSRRMLAWVCARLRPANVLSATDLALYEQLEMEGKLLEGEDLDFAFDSISAFSDNGENKEDTFFWEESLEDIRDSKHALRAEVADLEKQLASLEWKLDLLTAQATTITQGKKSRSSAKTCANRQLTGLDEKLSKRSLEMNAVLGKLAATTQEVSYYHSEADIGVYLSYCDFQSYVSNNLACTKELNKWFSRKFEKGPLQLVVKEDTSRGDSVNSHHFIVELNRINSMRKNSELAEELKDLSLQMQKCLSETITGLCADLALLEGANILQGDHKLKLMRQECYISHQKKFINHLVNQLVAHQFLKIACQLEKRTKISSAYSLLKAIELELQSYLSVVNGRLDRYHSIDQAASEMFEEGSVDDRDSFLHAVRDILSSHSSSQAVPPTYVSSYGLIEQISELQDELHYLQHEVENVLPRERGRCVDELCGMIQTVEQILSVPLSDEQPKLTPWPLVQSLQELEIISQQVSGSVNEVTVARNENAEILKQSSRNTHQERRVFVDFFCHPRRLENQVKELVSRVRALPE